MTVKQVERLAAQTIPLLDRTIANLRGLAPPKEEQNLADRWIASLRGLRVDAAKIKWDRAVAEDHPNDAGRYAVAWRRVRTRTEAAA